MYFESESDAINFTANISAGLIEVPSLLPSRSSCSRSKVLKVFLSLLRFRISTLLYIVSTVFPKLEVQMRWDIFPLHFIPHSPHPSVERKWLNLTPQQWNNDESWSDWLCSNHEHGIKQHTKEISGIISRNWCRDGRSIFSCEPIQWCRFHWCRECPGLVVFLNGATLCWYCIDCCCGWKRSNLTYWPTGTDSCRHSFHDSPPKSFANCGNCLLPSHSQIGGSYCSCDGCSNISTEFLQACC